jgi:hypothetical protein
MACISLNVKKQKATGVRLIGQRLRSGSREASSPLIAEIEQPSVLNSELQLQLKNAPGGETFLDNLILLLTSILSNFIKCLTTSP